MVAELTGTEPLATGAPLLCRADPVLRSDTRKVLDLLGLELPAGQPIAARQLRQADALNAEWADRYRVIQDGHK